MMPPIRDLPGTALVIAVAAGTAAAATAAVVGNTAAPSTSSSSLPPSSSLSDLPYDANGRLSTHLLVYPRECATPVETALGPYAPHGRRLLPLSGGASSAVFGDWRPAGLSDGPPPPPSSSSSSRAPPGLGDCVAACLERGTERSVVHATLPSLRFDGPTEGGGFRDWLEDSCQAAEFGFINYRYPETRGPVKLFWVSGSGEKFPHGELGWGEENMKFVETYLGHTFLIEDSYTGEPLVVHTVEFAGVLAVGRKPSLVDPSLNLTGVIRRTLLDEWDRHLKVKRTFTPLGFGKGRLPDDIFASMGAYNYNNNDYRALEEWDDKGVYVNWWETDVMIIQIPWKLRVMWQTRIKALVEAWANTDLENTSLYGLRRYGEGSRLLTHVDRVTTHAASVIINVAQGNVSRPWTVEIHDHADRMHELVMEPGDIVYYESARCLHGRNSPLRGDGAHYVNVFSHYRPTSDPDWYLRPNPEGTPEPLMDVGECWLEGPPDVYSRGAVRCDDPRIGPHLSPAMFTAHSGEDLFEWWRKVGQESEEEENARGKSPGDDNGATETAYGGEL